MTIIWRNLLKGALLLAIGAVAYYGLQATDQAMLGVWLRGGDPPEPEALPVMAPPGDEPSRSAQRRGNAWITQAATRLEQTQALSVEITQVGWVNKRLVETFGEYRQLDWEGKRCFSYALQGRLADRPTKLLRVSDGRLLWTDLVWRGDGPEPTSQDRSISRVDLRRLRQQAEQHTPELSPGDAVAEVVDPSDWPNLVGLPMLLASLGEHFDFGPGRLMELRGTEVVALVGRWNPVALRQVFGAVDDDPSVSVELPPRAPLLVVVALDKQTLFPRLIEYRSAGDPLADARLTDEALLQPSRRPLLKIDLNQPVLDAQLDPETFVYSRPEGIEWTDRTDLALRRTRDRSMRASVANAVDATDRR